jgi:hypothetical protein
LPSIALVLLALVVSRYLQVEVADKHSSPFTGKYEFDVRQLIDGPPSSE